jgi:hypothetical protein
MSIKPLVESENTVAGDSRRANNDSQEPVGFRRYGWNFFWCTYLLVIGTNALWGDGTELALLGGVPVLLVTTGLMLVAARVAFMLRSCHPRARLAARVTHTGWTLVWAYVAAQCYIDDNWFGTAMFGVFALLCAWASYAPYRARTT